MTRAAVIEVASGARRGHKIALSPGDELRVGRTADADLVIADDAELRGVHFALSWDGEACRVTHLADGAETTLDGLAIHRGDVRHGAVIHAGNTMVLVHIEGTARALWLRADGGAAAPAAMGGLARPLFVLLDLAMDVRLVSLLREATEPSASLLDGVAAARLCDVAPSLVSLPSDSGLFDALLALGWAADWGVYVQAPSGLADLRDHFARMLHVKNEQERELLFRFFDPRVLRDFLPMSTRRQRFELFGEAEAFVVRGHDGRPLRFTPDATEPEVLG